MIGGRASRVSVFDFIAFPKPTITQSPRLFQGRLQTSTRRSAAVFLQSFQVEGFMFGIPLKATINRMTCVADRHFPDKSIGHIVD